MKGLNNKELNMYSAHETSFVYNPFAAKVLSHMYYYPVPVNLNYFWGFGSILGFLLAIQVITGLMLAVHYTADVNMAFYSVEFMMRNVNNGWLFSYMHSSGASLLFIVMYAHMLSAMYYRSYKNVGAWLTGMVLFMLMMAAGFLGYILVWGQMSLWGATVITNLFGTIPVMGEGLVTFLWGGFAVDNPTLKRFFMLHFLMPLLMLVLVMLHLLQLHLNGSSNPLGMESLDFVCFYPKFYIKDLFGFVVFYGISVVVLVYWYPNLLGHPDNYVMANSLITPKHITPEWYFEPFYAILSSMPSKLGGVLVMGVSMGILFLLPLLEFTIASTKFSSIAQFCFWFFVGTFVCLGWLGMCPMEEPFVSLSSMATVCYFLYFVFFLPCMVLLEKLL